MTNDEIFFELREIKSMLEQPIEEKRSPQKEVKHYESIEELVSAYKKRRKQKH